MVQSSVISGAAHARLRTGGAARAWAALWLVALGGAAAQPAEGQDAAPPAISVTATPAFVSQYMFRGVYINGPALQPSIEADAGNLSVGLWGNFPVADSPAGNTTQEIDPYASFKVALNDRFSLSPGIQVYTYPLARTDEGSFRCTVEPDFGLNYVAGALTLSPKVYYDLIARSTTCEFNAGYSVPLTAFQTELDFAATLGGYSIDRVVNADASGLPQVRARGGYWLAGVSVPVTLGRGAKLTVGYAYTSGFATSLSEAGSPQISNPIAMGRPVLSVSLAYTF